MTEILLVEDDKGLSEGIGLVFRLWKRHATHWMEKKREREKRARTVVRFTIWHFPIF